MPRVVMPPPSAAFLCPSLRELNMSCIPLPEYLDLKKFAPGLQIFKAWGCKRSKEGDEGPTVPTTVFFNPDTLKRVYTEESDVKAVVFHTEKLISLLQEMVVYPASWYHDQASMQLCIPNNLCFPNMLQLLLTRDIRETLDAIRFLNLQTIFVDMAPLVQGVTPAEFAAEVESWLQPLTTAAETKLDDALDACYGHPFEHREILEVQEAHPGAHTLRLVCRGPNAYGTKHNITDLHKAVLDALSLQFRNIWTVETVIEEVHVHRNDITDLYDKLVQVVERSAAKKI
jgi:hypothetical protein